jgi:gas vesicle protein
MKKTNNMVRVLDILIGLLVGCLVGALATLLLAPRSGKRTRSQLQHQFMDLQDQIAETVNEVEEDALRQAHKVTANVRNTMEDFKQRGQAMFDRK